MLCGLDAVIEAFGQMSTDIELDVFMEDGAILEPGMEIAEVHGPLRPLLGGGARGAQHPPAAIGDGDADAALR